MTIRTKAMIKDVIISVTIGILAAAAFDCFGSAIEFIAMAQGFAVMAAVPVIGCNQIYEIYDKRERRLRREEHGRQFQKAS